MAALVSVVVKKRRDNSKIAKKVIVHVFGGNRV